MLVIDNPVLEKSMAEKSITERKYSEKRNFIRMKISAPLSAKLNADRNQIEGLCLDLSGSGLLVDTPEPLAIGTELDVEVSSGHGHNPTLKAHARVVRSTANGHGGCLLGMEILQMIQ